MKGISCLSKYLFAFEEELCSMGLDRVVKDSSQAECEVILWNLPGGDEAWHEEFNNVSSLETGN
jgi:hypothetical protein